MHSFKSKLSAVIAICLVLALIVLVGKSGMEISAVKDKTAEETQTAAADKNTITIWYTDEALTEYLESAAVSYADANEGMRVEPVLVSGMEYLESISEASVQEDGMPDLYIVSNDMLEKAHLAGLAAEIEPPEDLDISAVFPQVATDAAAYNGKLVGYPMYFECAAFLYNSTYVNDWSVQAAEAEIDTEEGEAAQAEIDNADTSTLQSSEEITADEADQTGADETEVDSERQERIDTRSAQLLDEYFPTSIDKLLEFSDQYDAPEGVEGIFEWDVNDIFYNYFFIGSAIDAGGEYGDDPESVSIYNGSAVKGLETYQDLNRFFSINTDEITYDGVLEDFISGKILFSIVTTDAVGMLRDAVNASEMTGEYKFASLPDITDTMEARSMSVTDVIAVNGYTMNREAANDFAAYLCTQDPEQLYERTGKVSPLKDADYGTEDEYLDVFASEYERSVPVTKMLETSNLWVRLEELFAGVWDGADANAELLELSKDIEIQISGEAAEE